eukprot:11749772-Ditylum_brightwellii.AAC.1
MTCTGKLETITPPFVPRKSLLKSEVKPTEESAHIKHQHADGEKDNINITNNKEEKNATTTCTGQSKMTAPLL